MLIELPLKLQYRSYPTEPWKDSDWGPLTHSLAHSLLWMAVHGYDHWMEHRLVRA